MVDLTNINTVMMLNMELQQIASAIDIFDSGARITTITVASEDRMPARQTTVQTAIMDYPPQMVEAIKQYLLDREHAILSELGGLGVTGVDAELRR